MKIGLVLSGGASKCLAHLGVLKALFELDIKPDIIAATSGGALFGSYVAAGLTPDEAIETIMSKGIFNIFSPSRKYKGMFSAERIASVFCSTLPVSTFEELKIPMIVPVTDILNGTIINYSSGDIIQPIIAAASYPAIFEPVIIENHLLLDGGIMCNFPIALIREKCQKVIGVNVGRVYPLKEIKTQKKFFFRSIELAISRYDKVNHEQADVLLEPVDLNEYDKFDIKRGKDIFNKGYQYTLNKAKALTQLK